MFGLRALKAQEMVVWESVVKLVLDLCLRHDDDS